MKRKTDNAQQTDRKPLSLISGNTDATKSETKKKVTN